MNTLELEVLPEPLKERLRNGTWKRNNISTLERALTPGRYVVEVGAGLGYITQVIARLVAPGGMVVSFEPNPVLYAIAETRVASLEKTILVPAAVGVAPGMARLEGPADEPWRCEFVADECGPIMMHSLGGVLTPKDHFTVLVMDAEGAEHRLLREVDVHAQGIRDIITEIHGNDSAVADLVADLAAMGWTLRSRSRRDSWDNVCVWFQTE